MEIRFDPETGKRIEKEKKGRLLESMPLLPLRDLVVFPHMTMQCDVGRPKSIAAVEEALYSHRPLLLVCQKDEHTEAPLQGDLYAAGTVAFVRQLVRKPGEEGIVRVALQGVRRAHFVEMTVGDEKTPYDTAFIAEFPPALLSAEEAAAYKQSLCRLFGHYAELAHLPPDVLKSLEETADVETVGDTIAGNLFPNAAERQNVLQQTNVRERLESLMVTLQQEIEVGQTAESIARRVQGRLEKGHKEMVLRTQMDVLRQELGENDEDEIHAYLEKAESLPLNEEALDMIRRECKRLESTHAAEGDVIRTHIEWILEMPWGVKTTDNTDMQKARNALDSEHYGMEKVKDRIVEQLAVRTLAHDKRAPILCFVGPPGVGKTSIAHSIAAAMDRKFARMSLGGVHDEAEIRGHRRTYIGAIPGRVIAAVRQAGTQNPVILMDEIDKMASDMRGDPASALLEVLDGEQNSTFRDHYLDIPYDISDVLFLTTANSLETIQPALLDRMEVIELPSYLANEKLHIAREHLLARQMERHGLMKKNLRISDEAIMAIIEGYTREAGVRQLEREIAGICRKAALRVADGTKSQMRVEPGSLPALLGAPKFLPEEKEEQPQIGVVTGLAFTTVGGVTMPIEVATMPGDGKLTLTGSLGDVMQESARAALSFVRANCETLGIPKDFYKTLDIHIHVPEGAVPKDGPSAGITITTALVSALSGTPVRSGIAMTGEVTLRGRVLPIGGLREKTMAAVRLGVKTVLFPEGNLRDSRELPEEVRLSLRLIPVSTMQQVLREALLPADQTDDAPSKKKSPRKSLPRSASAPSDTAKRPAENGEPEKIVPLPAGDASELSPVYRDAMPDLAAPTGENAVSAAENEPFPVSGEIVANPTSAGTSSIPAGDASDQPIASAPREKEEK